MTRPIRCTTCSPSWPRDVRILLTVILERDGSYPPMDHLLKHLDLAREAMTREPAPERTARGAITSLRKQSGPPQE